MQSGQGGSRSQRMESQHCDGGFRSFKYINGISLITVTTPSSNATGLSYRLSSVQPVLATIFAYVMVIYRPPQVMSDQRNQFPCQLCHWEAAETAQPH